jgi:beta-aspartyl-peptidase (threonine type)
VLDRSIPVLFGAILLPGLLTAPAHAVADEEEAAAIRKVLDKQVTDWNRKDLDAFLEGYWKSPKVVFQSGGTRFNGFDAMRERYRKSYQAEGKEMGTLAFSDVDIVVLGSDAALVRGKFQLTMSDGKRPSGIYTLVMRKLPEGWRIVHDHTSS